MNTFKTNIGEGDAEVEVEYNFYGGYPGSYYQPPEPDEVEILSVLYKGIDIYETLVQCTVEYIEEKAFEEQNERFIDYLESKAEEEYENRKMETIY